MSRHKDAPLHWQVNTGHRKTTCTHLTDLATLRQALFSLQPWRSDDRETWFKIGMVIHAETDGSDAGRELWDAWSQQSDRYQAKAIQQQWRSFKTGGGLTAGTLYRMADSDSPGWRGTVALGARPRAPIACKPTHPVRRARRTSKATYPTAEAAMASLAYLGKVSSHWVYLDTQWMECGIILRSNRPDGTKMIRPVSRQLDDTWAVGAMPAPRPLFNLPFLRESGNEEPVFLCEGEKDASILTDHGLIASTSSGGANAAHKTDFSPLAGRDVILCPDNDPAGSRYAEVVTEILQQLHPPATVRVLDVSDLPPKASLADELARRAEEGGHVE